MDDLSHAVLQRVATLNEALARITGTDAESERLRRRLEDMLLPPIDLQPERWVEIEARIGVLEQRVAELEPRSE